MARKSKYGNMPQSPAYMARVKGDAGTFERTLSVDQATAPN